MSSYSKVWSRWTGYGLAFGAALFMFVLVCRLFYGSGIDDNIPLLVTCVLCAMVSFFLIRYSRAEFELANLDDAGCEYDPAGTRLLGRSERFKDTITEYSIPVRVCVIEPYAFRDCVMLERVEIPASVQEVGNGAFAGCGWLEEVVFRGRVKQMGDLVFDGCRKLGAIQVNRQDLDYYSEMPFMAPYLQLLRPIEE